MIQINNLSTHFSIKSKRFFKKDILKAIENVSLTIPENQVLGLVGESGCGKSTLGRSILKLIPVHEGEVLYKGSNILNLSNKDLKEIRKELQIVFQDPYSSLNPRMTIFEILKEGLDIHFNLTKSQSLEKAEEILNKVNLKSEILTRYPHEFSGGQRQRISIARSLILKPNFLVCDEVTSALDVSNQAQIINLLNNYKKKENLSILFISHDLNVVSYISNYIAIMYLGKIVELAKKEEIINQPKHPYTKALFSNIFDLSKRNNKRDSIAGEIPGAINKPNGCYFSTRCKYAQKICFEQYPVENSINKDHIYSCHFPLN
jgi:peptide/nickel transport system ATP-binding protein